MNEFAALLRYHCGLKPGDRVTFHLPMVPELPVAMLACARLGVIHSQVSAGFSGAAAGGRIADSGSRVLITMDAYQPKRIAWLPKFTTKQPQAASARLKRTATPLSTSCRKRRGVRSSRATYRTLTA